MSSTLARPILRQSRAWGRMAPRRFESTTASTTASKASETAKQTASKASAAAAEYSAKASEYTAKAAQGLSRVTSSAAPAITNAAKGIAESLGKVGGRTGKVIAFIEKQTPTVIFYSKVVQELAKFVFKSRNMSPPPLTTVQSYWQNALKLVQNPSALRQQASKLTAEPATLIERARNVSRAQLVTGGVLLAECLGFFSVGEIIGRFKIVGYRGGSPAAHH